MQNHALQKWSANLRLTIVVDLAVIALSGSLFHSRMVFEKKECLTVSQVVLKLSSTFGFDLWLICQDF